MAINRIPDPRATRPAQFVSIVRLAPVRPKPRAICNRATPGTVRGVTFTVPDGALVPDALVAVTEHAYVMPFASPVTVIDEFAPLAANPPTLQVAVSLMIGEPPSNAGGERASSGRFTDSWRRPEPANACLKARWWPP